jgi:hypothetical protein
VAEDQPSNPGVGPPVGQSVGQWAPSYPAPLAPRSRIWPAVASGGIGVLLGAAALAVALTRSTSQPAKALRLPIAPPKPLRPNASCATHTSWERAVRVDTNGHDLGLGRVALTNAAAMLDAAAANPALDATNRDAAWALANAYRMATAMGSRDVATDAEFRASLDDINAKDAAVKKICGDG